MAIYKAHYIYIMMISRLRTADLRRYCIGTNARSIPLVTTILPKLRTHTYSHISLATLTSSTMALRIRSAASGAMPLHQSQQRLLLLHDDATPRPTGSPVTVSGDDEKMMTDWGKVRKQRLRKVIAAASWMQDSGSVRDLLRHHPIRF
jgi:hypothetical protein